MTSQPKLHRRGVEEKKWNMRMVPWWWCYISMHHSGLWHDARSVIVFLGKKYITVLLWPMNSPDMNLMEKMWELIKRTLAKASIEGIPRDHEVLIASRDEITDYCNEFSMVQHSNSPWLTAISLSNAEII